MCTYLEQVGSTYYFRRVVPLELRPFILTATGKPRAEFKISLKTKDRSTAKRMLPEYTRMSDKEFDQAREKLREGRTGSQPDNIGNALRAAPRPALRAFTEGELQQMQWATDDEADRQARWEEREPLRQRLLAAFERSTAHITPKEAAMRDLLREVQFELTLEQERRLARGVERAEERRGIIPRVAPISPLPSSNERSRGKSEPSAATVPLLATFDAYASATGIKPGTAVEWRARIGDLIAFLEDDDAARLTTDDVLRWRDHLLSETVKGGKKRTARTVRNTYISALRATLNWAVEERKLPQNVAQGVTVRVPKKVRLRQPDFTMDEARRILAASFIVDPKLSADRAFARRWIPWLCAYTGGRVNEFSQLRREDVRQQDGIWVATITPEAGTQKANEARTVPLHSHLVEQGFVTAVAAKPEGPLFYDPAKQRVEGDGNRHFKKVGERLAKWVRDEVGISDPAVQPNHAWRHLFKTLAMAVGMDERVADCIQGHAPKTVSRTYGSVPLKTMAEAVEKLPRFEP